MIETECQQLIVDAAKSAGGQALKLNNRFLIGVVDLLVKMPGHVPMWLEAKKLDLSDRTQNHVWDVGCTKKQQDFLRDWHEAGMLTGVASFIQTKGGNVSTLRLALYDYRDMVFRNWQVEQKYHKLLGGKDERLITIQQMLTEFERG